MLYEFRITTDKTLDDGSVKQVKEHYICDAELHGEAEKIGYELYPNANTDVTSVGRSDVREIINESKDGEFCYKAVVTDTYVDDNGKEKELKYPMLVFADNFSQATSRINEFLKQGYDMTLDCVKRVKIVDYIRYE